MRRWNVTYATRMKVAVAVSVGIHVLVLASPVRRGGPNLSLTPALTQPIVLNLNEPKPERRVRLVEPSAPAERPPDADTDLIAEQASNARDMADTDGDRAVPHTPLRDEFDAMPRPATQAPERAPEEAAAPPVEETPDSGAREREAARTTAEDGLLTSPESPAESRETESYQLAKAEPPPMPPADSREASSRVEGGVKGRGVIAFAAKQDELAAYLRQIQTRVETRWKTLIAMRYSGAQPTKVVLDCAITPEGKLAAATIVDAGDSPSFAPLCKEAIEKASPFAPFPFAVPKVYRNENLEIRWTFSFLQR